MDGAVLALATRRRDTDVNT